MGEFVQYRARDLFVAMPSPASAADRWAAYAARGCESDADLKTLERWASLVNVSYTSLCESCRLMRVRPRDARDLVRVLRAVIQAPLERCPPDVLLDVSDRRTLRALLRRGGLEIDAAASGSLLHHVLDHQQFVPAENQGFRRLRALLVGSAADARTPST